MASNLFDQINIRGYIDGWARNTIELWKKELKKKGIGVTGELERSFTKEVQRKGAEIAAVTLKFKMYGRFIDMGVGNGLAAYERTSNRQNQVGANRYGASVNYHARKPERWLNKIKTAQTYRLGETLNYKASQVIATDFNNTNSISIQING